VNDILDWTECLEVKVPKCRTVGLADKRWKSGDNKGLSFGPFDPKLMFNSEVIKFIDLTDDMLFKFLGRKIASSVSDMPALELTRKDFETDIETVDKQPLSGASKVWLYQFMVMARLIWPFLVYSFSLTGIKPFEDFATKYIKKWYAANKPLNREILFLPKEVSGWNLKSPLTLFKSMQIVGQHILKYSNDPLTLSLSEMSRHKARLSKDRKWRPGAVLDRLETQLDFSIQYSGQTGSKGLGFGPPKISRHSSYKDKRHELSNLCKGEDAAARILSLQDLARSGDFLKWDNLMSTQTDWNTQILQLSDKELSFTLNGQALTLPSPSNLRRWGFNPVASCQLCGRLGASASHILAGCNVGLNQGRFTYRHNNILRSILCDLRGLIASSNRRLPCETTIPPISNSFILAGKKKATKKSLVVYNKPLLHLADDWELQVDLDGSFCWPIKELPETARPDVMWVSVSRRIVIWGELTSPMERRIDISAIKKKERYMKLKSDLMVKEWRVFDFTFEVGALGFVSNKLSGFLLKLGFPSCQAKYMINRMSIIARRSSFYIWNARHSLTWNPPVICAANALPKPKISSAPSDDPVLDAKMSAIFAAAAAFSASKSATAAASAAASSSLAVERQKRAVESEDIYALPSIPCRPCLPVDSAWRTALAQDSTLAILHEETRLYRENLTLEQRIAQL
jgi:hypothetical protein